MHCDCEEKLTVNLSLLSSFSLSTRTYNTQIFQYVHEDSTVQSTQYSNDLGPLAPLLVTC